MFGGSLLDLIPLSKRLSFALPEFQVIWATGDAALGRFAATNWPSKHYIVEDSEEFLADINFRSRMVIVSDVEQLASTRIIVMWGETGKILLLGTDNRNVLA